MIIDLAPRPPSKADELRAIVGVGIVQQHVIPSCENNTPRRERSQSRDEATARALTQPGTLGARDSRNETRRP